MKLFWIFLIVPVIEIALFIQVGGLIGLWPTLALVLLTAVVGASIVRAQGARAVLEIQSSLQQLRDPTRPMAHGAMILIAGLLLLTPGLFTDAVGALLLIPALRDAVMRRAAKHISIRPMTHGGMGQAGMGQAGMGPGGPVSGNRRRDPSRPPYNDGVIDGDYVVEPDDLPAGRDPRMPPRPDILPAHDDDDTPPPPRGGSGWTRH